MDGFPPCQYCIVNISADGQDEGTGWGCIGVSDPGTPYASSDSIHMRGPVPEWRVDRNLDLGLTVSPCQTKGKQLDEH